MEFEKKLQDAITNITPHVFAKRLMLFGLISDNEYQMLLYNITQKQGNQINSDISQYILQKLHNESSIYYERFKYFLGYYEELGFIYHLWKSISKLLLSVISILSVHTINLSLIN